MTETTTMTVRERWTAAQADMAAEERTVAQEAKDLLASDEAVLFKDTVAAFRNRVTPGGQLDRALSALLGTFGDVQSAATQLTYRPPALATPTPTSSVTVP